MAWTEQDLREIEDELKKDSQGVGDVPEAESLDGITSLPAYQEKDGEEIIVRAPLELLAAPALEAADKANEAADKAESNATAAQTAANTANEKAELAAQAASDATAAKEEAETATQSANNAASNAEEKAEAANTAAQDAEKVANNPTYIGTDHYVYVYNKETDSFDKTGIYCKGEPGSSFRIAGEYATLEALKSAVPDGSAVDGFMAVGTEAPYDYYAWVNGDWVNQGKIAGGGSGNVVVIPAAAMSLSDQATSDEIFNAFGGKDAFMDICQSIVNKDTVCVVANIPEESGMKIVYIPAMAMATYTDANNANLMIAIITQTTFQLGITVTDGIATQSSQVLNHIYEAPSDGSVYGRKNKDWVEVLEKSKTVEYKYDLREADLDTFKGSGGDIAFIGIQRNNKFATPENHYPLNEAGTLIVAGTITEKTNQIYHTYNSNRIFIRCATSSGENRSFSDWVELAKVTNVLTKTNTSSFTPTQPYHPAPKAYVDNSISNSRSVGYMMQLTEIDASGLDENTWYPVVMPLGNRYTVRIEVIVGLDSITKPSWSTHNNGFSVRKIWEVNGDGWGTSPVNRQIFVSDYKFADIDPVRGVGQLTNFSNEYVFVRGGGKYHFYTSHNTIPVLKTEIFVDEGGASISPTTETPAEIVANMATKKYVDEQMFLLTISDTGHQELISNQDTTGETAATKINTVFGSADNFKNVVSQLMANKRLVIKITETERFQPGVIHSYMNIDNGAYELSFDYNHSRLSSTGATLLSKRILIAMNNNYGNFFIVRDIVTSDNITTLTKKSTEQYAAITDKDANTAYCVTD